MRPAVRIVGLSILASFALHAQIITTFAGTDFQFPTGSLPALNAPLGFPQGVAVDLSGNVYISDRFNYIVVKVDTDGTLTTVAGNGLAGFSGDGGPGSSGALGLPLGIAVDNAGNLYIADSGNGRVRMVSNGIITTIAGTGDYAYTGDGGPATAASFKLLSGIAVDSAGDVYISDTGTDVIRKISNGTITTVAGNGTSGYTGDGGPATSASLNEPSGIAVDAAGNLYIADLLNRVVRKVSGGVITTLAGNGKAGYSGDGGPATKAAIDEPAAVTVDSAGNVYIADQNYSVVRRVSGPFITTYAGNGNSAFTGDGGLPARASLNYPSALTVDPAGNLYIADTGNRRARKISADTITTIAGNGNYRFSGDGGPATSAALYDPAAIAFDPAGNLYIADVFENRIRKVSNGIISTVIGNGIVNFSPQGIAVDAAGNLYFSVSPNAVLKFSNGVITTFAGTGTAGFRGDNGPATSAELNNPSGVAVDAAGNLYIADSNNNRVRKVSGGTITTVAGNGTAGFSGDGGPATSAAINLPGGLAVDSAGNLYITDSFNERIREVSNGTITTVAGNGIAGYSGDGGPATDAELFPEAVAVDSAQNIYIADLGNNRIRKVTGGIITTIAGTGAFTDNGDGGPAITASLAVPTAVAVDNAGNIYIADPIVLPGLGSARIREILSLPPVLNNPLQQGSTSVSLTQSSGGKPVTAYVNADASTSGSASVGVPGVAYTASVTSGSSWLSVAPQSGTTPGLLTVTANPLNLPPEVYNGTILISVPMADPPTQTVNVTFTVTAPIPPTLSLDQSHMSFTYATTSTARSQTLIVSNSGGGSLNFTTSVVLNSGVSANWLSVSPQIGTATPGNPVSLAVTADPSMLGPGTYTASLTVNGGAAGSITIPITITIATNPLVMLLSQAGLTFTAVQNGGAIPPQTFGVLNLGSGTLNWTVQTSTLSGGNWLMATPSSGSSGSASVSGAPLVSVSVNPAGLAPGVYYGLVKVISPGAANTPQEVVAVLQVLPAGSDIAPIVQPTSLLFSAPAGFLSPSSQTVSVYDPTGTGKSYRSGPASSSSLEILPTDATISAAAPTEIVLQPNVSDFSPGTYSGAVTLQFSDGRVNTVGITFVVTNPAASTSENPRAAPHDSGSCTPTKLIPVLTTLGQGFTVPAGYPEGLTVQVTDDCGNPLTQGQVSVEFSTGQGLKYMKSLNNGRWDVTWDTGSQQNSSVTLTVHAVHPTLPITGDAQVSGALGALQAPPQVTDRGVVSAASFTATPVAPGGFISIFGSLLSDATSSAQALPLPTTLNNTVVTLGDQPLPLFYTNNGSTSQLNALVPYETPINTSLQLLVQRDNTYATPVYVDVAAAQPGILEYGSAMQAVAVDLNGHLIGPSNPAHAGDLITLYCLGLGAVSPSVGDGAAAPSSPLAYTVNTVTVTVGGQTANVYFAGLTPTLAGLYQIDFYVPQNAGAGDQVQVVLSTAGQTSVGVNLSVQ